MITGYFFNDPHDYVSQVDEFVSWCDDHYLSLNLVNTWEQSLMMSSVGETKENEAEDVFPPET